MTPRPLLLLDVDGPLNPYGVRDLTDVRDYEMHWMRPDSWTEPGDLLVWLNPAHGPALLALPYDLVWATTWEAEAGEWIAPQIGLPTDLPYIKWPEKWAARSDCTYWKTHDIVRWADGRPFAWVDDEIDEADREYVAEHHDGPACLHYVDPSRGLTAEDFEYLTAWADRLAAGEVGR